MVSNRAITCYPETKDDHRCPECRAHPTQCSVELHLSASYECRLQDVKAHPTGENEGVHPKHNRWSRVGVDESTVNGATKPINNNCRDQQRHAKVKVLFRNSCVWPRMGNWQHSHNLGTYHWFPRLGIDVWPGVLNWQIVPAGGVWGNEKCRRTSLPVVIHPGTQQSKASPPAKPKANQ
jgi:hypothetical protein